MQSNYSKLIVYYMNLKKYLLFILLINPLSCREKNNDINPIVRPSSILYKSVTDLASNTAIVNFEIDDPTNNILSVVIIASTDTLNFWQKENDATSKIIKVDKSSCSNASNRSTCSGRLTGLSPSTKYYVGLIQINGFDVQNRGVIKSAISSFETIWKIPVITNNTIPTDVKAISANLTYTISDFGGPNILETGLCYSTRSNPTINDTKFKMDSVENYLCTNPYPKGSIKGIMYPLNPNTVYYVRPYAVNVAGVGYGKEYSFTTQDNLTCLPKAIDLAMNGSIMNLKRYDEPGIGSRVILMTSALSINAYWTRGHIYQLNTDGSYVDDLIFRSIQCSNGVYGDIMSPSSNSFEVLSDGKILVNMSSTNSTNKKIWRLNKDGSIDNSFNVTTNSSNTSILFKMHSDGRIYICGNFTAIQGVPFYDVARLNANGTLDQSFQYKAGRVTVLDDFEVMDDGKIVLAGLIDGKRNIIRLNSNGDIDVGFKTNFINFEKVNSIIKQSDGKVLIGVRISGITRLYRLNLDGSIDNTFSIGTFSKGSGQISNIFTMYRTLDNKYLIGGDFNSFNSINAFGLVKINLDGSRDNSFNLTKQFSTRAIVENADGKLIISAQESPWIFMIGRDGSFCK